MFQIYTEIRDCYTETKCFRFTLKSGTVTLKQVVQIYTEIGDCYIETKCFRFTLKSGTVTLKQSVSDLH